MTLRQHIIIVMLSARALARATPRSRPRHVNGQMSGAYGFLLS